MPQAGMSHDGSEFEVPTACAEISFFNWLLSQLGQATFSDVFITRVSNVVSQF